MKILRVLISIVLILGSIAVGGYFYAQNYYNNAINSTDGSEDIVGIEVPEGSTSSDISRLLLENDLIENELIFKYYLREEDKGPLLKAGKYEFRQNQSLIQIVDELVKGSVAKGVIVTIIEGLRYDEIATSLETDLAANEITFNAALFTDIVKNPSDYTFPDNIETFLSDNKPADKNLEGFLYPDTYEFAKDVTEEEIVEKLIQNLINKTADFAAPTGGYTYYEYLTLASIVQREAFRGEYPEIAGIFVRRLNVGDKLGADATLLYPYKRWKPEPTYQELNADTAYNTRKNIGLTPTPISNPGIEAISGTWNAEESEYYFFIHDLSGNTHFAKTLSEHERNISLYLQ